MSNFVLPFLNLFSFLSVVLRGVILSLGSVALGGVFFRMIDWKAAPPVAARRLLTVSAFGLAAAQLFYVFVNSEVVSAVAELSLADLVGASYFVWGCAGASAAFALGLRSMRRSSRIGVLELLCSGVILSATVATSHAAARLDHRLILVSATAIHQAFAATWIGGLPYLVLTVRTCSDLSEAAAICKRFSRLALCSVPLLLGAGLVLSRFYIADARGLYGTTYVVMVVAKGLLFALILCLGALNFQLIRNRSRENGSWLTYLKLIWET